MQVSVGGGGPVGRGPRPGWGPGAGAGALPGLFAPVGVSGPPGLPPGQRRRGRAVEDRGRRKRRGASQPRQALAAGRRALAAAWGLGLRLLEKAKGRPHPVCRGFSLCCLEAVATGVERGDMKMGR